MRGEISITTTGAEDSVDQAAWQSTPMPRTTGKR